MATWSTEPGLNDPASSPLRALVAGFPGAAAHVSGNHFWMNAGAEEVVGYQASEITTKDEWGQGIHGDQEGQARAIYLEARSSGFSRPVEVTIRRKDGALRLVEFSAYLGRDEEVWMMRDITDSDRAARQLREREQRLQVAVATAGLGTWEWHVAERRVVADARTRQMFGLGNTRDEDALYPYLRAVVPEDRRRLLPAMKAAVDTGSTFDIEIRVGAGHGRSRWLRIHGAMVEDPDSAATRLIGAVRDIDSYKRLDERLVHAARMESLGQLAGGVAHDFNNLLAVIRGHAEFAARDKAISEKTAARLHTIERAVDKGAQMVADLMQLGHRAPPTVTVVNMNEVLRSSADSLAQIAGEDVTLEMGLDASEPHVRIDEARLSALVLNLVTNARDAMPMGGLISISTSTTSPAPGSAGDDERWAQLMVEDTGTGMDPETMTRIFEPFFTTKAPAVGTGLGLASVYDTVIDAGGSIDVASRPLEGTVFTISLPCASADTPEQPASAPAPSRAASDGRLVLVVEDEPTILDLAADILRSAGYRVVEALGPRIALEYAETGEQPDVLLTDVVMPGISGRQLAEHFQARYPGLPVLFMSGYTSEGRGEVPLDDSTLIRKPFSHHQLLERIAQLLSSRT